MKRSPIGSALIGMAVCAAACAVLWPHARDAGAILAARADPAELSDLQLNSALRNDRAVVEQNIEAALAAGDAVLAGSFATRAGAKLAVPFGTEFPQWSPDRKPRRCREPVGHRRRRPVRVRRHPGRGARR